MNALSFFALLITIRRNFTKIPKNKAVRAPRIDDLKGTEVKV